MMTFPSKTLAGMCAVFALGACQVETANEAPAAVPAVAAAPAPAAAVAPSGPLTKMAAFDAPLSFGGGTLSSNRGGGKTRIGFAAQIKNVGGELAVCGVRGSSGVGSRRFVDSVANRQSFFVGNENVMSNLSYFTSVAGIDAITKSAPTCKSTGKPWSNSYVTAPQSIRLTGARTFGG